MSSFVQSDFSAAGARQKSLLLLEMSTTTYFGDVVTTGNTNLVQNLTALGAYSYFASNIVGGQNIGTVTTPFGFLYASSANTTSMNVGSIQAPAANFGNVFSSNAYQGGNLFAVRVNVSGTANVTSLAVASNVGTGGANLTVQGNVYVSNIVTTTNLLMTAMNVARITNVQSLFSLSNIGIGGANLNVTGNAWISNSIQTVNLFATTMNAGTMNTATLFTSNIGVGTIAAGNAMSVSGNIFVSNSVTATNIIAVSANTTNINVATMNLTSVVVTGTANVPQTINTSVINVVSIYTNTLGINGLPSAGASLQVFGNVFASNTLSGANLTATGTIYYNEDLTKRSIHLTPTAANASAIQSWISATCNASDQPSSSWWPTSQLPVFGNVVTGPAGGSAYSGGVYLPDGRVLFVPSTTSNIGIYNPQNFTFTRVSGASPGYSGGVLLPNGNVVFVPQIFNVGVFNPVSYKFSNSATLSSSAYNGVLTSNGIAFTPLSVGANAVAIYNPTTGTAVNVLTRGGPLSPAPVWSVPTTSLKSLDSACLWTSIAWSPGLGMFVALGRSGAINLAYSYDGITWGSGITDLFDPTISWYSVAWNSNFGYFIAMGSGGTSYNSAWSDTGTLWHLMNVAGVGGSNPWYIAASPDAPSWVAVGQNGNAVWTDDPQAFYWNTPTYNNFSVRTTWLGVAYGNGKFVAVGTGSQDSSFNPCGSMVSDDSIGGSWTATTLQIDVENIAWNAVAYSPTLAVWVAVSSAVSATYRSAWSSDGSFWNIPTTSIKSVDSACRWNSVTWSPEQAIFVAVGSSGTLNSAYSPDGQNWYAYASIKSADSAVVWNGINWSPSLSLFAAVGSGGTYNSAYAYYPTYSYPVKSGSVLLPSGNILFNGQTGTSNMILFDPVSLSQSNIVVGTSAYSGLVLAPNGNVVAVPSDSNACVINPSTATSTNVVTGGGFSGGVLLASGNVIFVPLTSSNVGMLDPVALRYSNSSQSTGFSGGTLLPSGQVVFTPSTSTNVGVLDTFTPAPQEFCLSPYFNKY
jgi:hypothetical protein